MSTAICVQRYAIWLSGEIVFFDVDRQMLFVTAQEAELLRRSILYEQSAQWRKSLRS